MRYVEIDAPHLLVAGKDHQDLLRGLHEVQRRRPAIRHEYGTPAGMQLDRAV